MARFAIEDDGLPGLTLALRLRLKGHDVGLLPRTAAAPVAPAFTLPAPYRDLFLKSGPALESLAPISPAPGRSFLLGDVPLELPSVGPQAPVIGEMLGSPAQAQWTALLREAADIWGVLRQRPYRATRSLRALARQHLRDARLRRMLDEYVGAHGVDPVRVGDTAVVLPYLDQTFGRWQFDAGMGELEALLRGRCQQLGVGVGAAADPVLNIGTFWQDAFQSPRTRWRSVAPLAVRTHELGLPWIGMAAERVADGVGRAQQPGA